MKKLKTASLAIPLFLLACENQEKIANSDQGGGFDQGKYAENVLSLKKQFDDPKELSYRVLELQKSLNIPGVDKLIVEGSINNPYLENSIPLKSTEGSRQPVQKRSAALTLVKDYDLWVRKSYSQYNISVARGTTITIQANAIGTADPFLVLFYDGIVDYANARILDYDDDGNGGLSSIVSWTHPSGSSSSHFDVDFMVFSANAEAGVGNVDIVINNNGTITNVNNVAARGVGAVSNNVAQPPCSTPNYSKITLTPGPTGGTVFAMNASNNYLTTVLASGQFATWIPDMAATSTPNFVIYYLPHTSGASESVGTLEQYDNCP